MVEWRNGHNGLTGWRLVLANKGEHHAVQTVLQEESNRAMLLGFDGDADWLRGLRDPRVKCRWFVRRGNIYFEFTVWTAERGVLGVFKWRAIDPARKKR